MNQMTTEILSNLESINKSLEILTKGVSINDTFALKGTLGNLVVAVISSGLGGVITISLFKRQEKIRNKQELILNFYKEYKLIYNEVIKEIQNICNIIDSINISYKNVNIEYYYKLLGLERNIDIVKSSNLIAPNNRIKLHISMLLPSTKQLLNTLDVLIPESLKLEYLFISNSTIVKSLNKNIEIMDIVSNIPTCEINASKSIYYSIYKDIELVCDYFDNGNEYLENIEDIKESLDNIDKGMSYWLELIGETTEKFRDNLIILNNIIEQDCIGKYFNCK